MFGSDKDLKKTLPSDDSAAEVPVPQAVQTPSALTKKAFRWWPVGGKSSESAPHIPAPNAAVPAALVPVPEQEPVARTRYAINAGAEVLHAAQSAATAPVVLVAPAPSDSGAEAAEGFFQRLKHGLTKTSTQLAEGVVSLLVGKKVIDEALLMELEDRLLLADIGVPATQLVMQRLSERIARKELANPSALYQALQQELIALLKPVEQPLVIPETQYPYVILVVGVNGVGKTTTIGKLAHRLQNQGKKVMLAAGDTFRAAAVEQLQVWGQRYAIPVIAQHTGADAASVIFDAVQAAQARGMDVLIADTAGRLHNKDHLMEELKKVQRVMAKLDQSAPHEVLLVLDAATGQNALNQARQFHQAIPLTGLVLTKLDGTAKGGMVFALAQACPVPVRYIGIGEGVDDLRPFLVEQFVRALFMERVPS